MAGFENDVGFSKNYDFTAADNQNTSEANGLISDGQLWIGSTAKNIGGTHINVGGLTSPNSTILIGYSSPNITLDTAFSDLHTARYIVSAGGTADGANYTTIASAYAAATLTGTPQTIFVQPGIYTENITLSNGINITGFSTDGTNPSVTILGKITATYSGAVTLSGICLKTNGDVFLTSTGSNSATLYMINCLMLAFDANGMLINNPNFVSYIYNSFSNEYPTYHLFDVTNGQLEFLSCRLSSLSSSQSTQNALQTTFNNCNSGLSILTTGSGWIRYFNCQITPLVNVTALTTSGTSPYTTIDNCIIDTGTSSAITVGAGTVVNLTNSTVKSSNANAITGAGTLIYGSVIFTGSSTVNVTTQTGLPLSTKQGGTNVTSAGTAGNVLTSNGTNWTSAAPAVLANDYTKFFMYGGM